MRVKRISAKPKRCTRAKSSRGQKKKWRESVRGKDMWAARISGRVIKRKTVNPTHGGRKYSSLSLRTRRARGGSLAKEGEEKLKNPVRSKG